MYQRPFQITNPVSNNAFHFDERANPHLFVPALRTGTLGDVRTGGEIAFEDFEDGQLRSCAGLEAFIRTRIAGIPAFIFDNHNHAFAFWHLALQERLIQKNATLLHVDGHRDNRLPDRFLSAEDAEDGEKVFTYTNTVLNVGNFIPAGQKTGVIGEVLQVTSEPALQILSTLDIPKNSILDLDLDFFAPELDYIPESLKLATLKRVMPKVRLMTIATSPFFIEQERAIRYLKILAHDAEA